MTSEAAIVDEVEELREQDPEVGRLIVLIALGDHEGWRRSVTPSAAQRQAAWLKAHPRTAEVLRRRQRG